MATITVIDSIMGSGKTTWIIGKMNHDGATAVMDGHANPYIYITPLLSEVGRIRAACPVLDFREPQPVNGRKLSHLNNLLAANANVCTTHKLFSLINDETREMLKEGSYTLVIDEETDWCREYEIKPADRRTLFASGKVWIDDRKRLRWNHDLWPDYDGKFNDIMALCDNGNLVVADHSLMIWEFPAEFLDLFSEVYILTYLFEGSLLSMYLRANQMPYTMMSIKEGELVPYEEREEAEAKCRARELLTIVTDPNLNRIGQPVGKENPLSASWFKKDIKGGGAKTKKLQLATVNFYRRYAGSKPQDNMWSCFREHRQRLKGDRYTRSWTASNLKATNDYADKWALAYLVNVFLRPRLHRYLQECGVAPDQDLYALSQLIQWVWRSRIRKGEPVVLYVPSERMRGLLMDWLNEGLEAMDREAA